MRDGASFTELSVDRLATEAGMSRASFYIYFEDKGHLLRRLAGQVFADLADSADRWWSVAGRHDPDDVRAAMAGIVASYRRHQPLLVALNEMAAYDAAVGATYREPSDRHHRPVDPCHRRRPGRRPYPPRAVRGDHGQRADLDGRAGVPAESSHRTGLLRCGAGRDDIRNHLEHTVSQSNATELTG